MKKIRVEGTDIEKIMKLFFQGKTVEEIANEFCIKNFAKVEEAYDNYCQIHGIKECHKKRVESISSQKLYELVMQNHTYRYISDLYHITETEVKSKVKKYCDENNLEFKKRNKDSKTVEMLEKTCDVSKIINDYKNGKTLPVIADELDWNVTTLIKLIVKNIGQEKYEEIRDANFRKRRGILYSPEEIEDIISLYEDGIPKYKICKKYKCNNDELNKQLLKYYKELGYTKLPRIVSKSRFLEIVNNHKYSRIELEQYTKLANMFIPRKYLDEYYKEELNIGEIKKFIFKKTLENDENAKKQMLKNSNISLFLKKNNYGELYQITALLYTLPQTTNTTMEEISKLVDNKYPIISAIRLLNSEEFSQEEYLNELEENEIAKVVKLAKILDEIKTNNLEQCRINLVDYKDYIYLASDTKLKDAFDSALEENRSYLPKYTGEEH